MLYTCIFHFCSFRSPSRSFHIVKWPEFIYVFSTDLPLVPAKLISRIVCSLFASPTNRNNREIIGLLIEYLIRGDPYSFKEKTPDCNNQLQILRPIYFEGNYYAYILNFQYRTVVRWRIAWSSSQNLRHWVKMTLGKFCSEYICVLGERCTPQTTCSVKTRSYFCFVYWCTVGIVLIAKHIARLPSSFQCGVYRKFWLSISRGSHSGTFSSRIK